MDRHIVYPGSVPLETDLLNTNKNVLTALGQFAQDVIGTGTIFSGVSCVPTIPAALTVIINPGCVYAQSALDTVPFSSLPTDAFVTTKQGILKTTQTFNTPAPATSGQSINYLISAAFVEADINPVVLPYYNAANPAQAFSGPNGNGTSNNTTRQDTVQLVLTTGVAAPTGSQTTPATPVGNTPLYVITVAFGQSTVTSANIVTVNGAPLLPQPLLAQIQTAPNGVVGTTLNLSMTVATASSTASITADEVLVETALGGIMYKVPSFSKSINLASVGAGGMDTGTAPVSGYVALYVIYNPTTGASALLASNATSAVAPNVHASANMPAGYTASALVSVWPTNASGQFAPAAQVGRTIYFTNTPVFTGSTVTGAVTTLANALSIASTVPRNAKSVGGSFTVQPGGAVTAALAIGANTTGFGAQQMYATATGVNQPSISSYSNVPIITAQTIYYGTTNPSGTPNFNISISTYAF